MSDRLGPVSYKTSEEDPFLGREIHQSRHFSEHTMELIDEEVAKILQDAAQKALNLLGDRRSQLQQLTDKLISDEELDQKGIRLLIGSSVHDEENPATEPNNGQPGNPSDADMATASSDENESI